ncbi:hypothetical protein BCR44DRAFT_1434332 [Catenaria anguillulae PL171]|uniref:phenylalanine--tRNA ligase n=1 Tax=Catenaria anguillulae PL171 TaxID=765915 RepID=A0A1Y2HLP6_9FUNG|nr:hypothetical protein BCR44DRAFT_1434332 [Catenaria anguillulae PL171]
MPTVTVDQEYLFAQLGQRYSTESFRELCFEFGIELEEDTSELAMAIDMIGEAAARAQGLSDKPLYKIDIPANRYDLLSPEGIAQALRVFLGLAKPPTYTVVGQPKFRIAIKKERSKSARTLYKHIAKYLPIIEHSPVYPVVLDANRTVCSLPPVINGDHSKITLNTRNVLIECTATDLTKAKIVLNTIVATYSQYCAKPFTVEPVKVIYPDGASHVYPMWRLLTPQQVVGHLERMGLPAKLVNNNKAVDVAVPITRSDILHACDIMEDVAIAYGFNKIPKTLPAVNTVGKPLPINKLSDLIRRELALSGFTEVLPLTLCSTDENYAYLRRPNPGNEAVVLANPKTIEYQVVRTTLIPGMLKTLRENKSRPLPLQVFEVSDVVLCDEREERRARNERRVAVAYANKNSGFEVVHGVLGRIFKMLNVPSGEWAIKQSEHATYFPGRQADVVYKGQVIGQFGILHPEVVEKFEVLLPVTMLEFNLEPFL